MISGQSHLDWLYSRKVQKSDLMRFRILEEGLSFGQDTCNKGPSPRHGLLNQIYMGLPLLIDCCDRR